MVNEDLFRSGMDGLKKESSRLTREVKERTLTYFTAALGLVAGLAWNDAIRALIEHLFPLSKDTLLAKFIYAVLITLVVVVFTVYLVRILKREEKQ